MQILVLDGPLNGQYIDVAVTTLPEDHNPVVDIDGALYEIHQWVDTDEIVAECISLGGMSETVAMDEQELRQRNGHLYWLLANLLEQMDWERRCEESGFEPRPLSWRHADIEKKARDEIAQTVQWWEHAQPEQPHRMVGSDEPLIAKRKVTQ